MKIVVNICGRKMEKLLLVVEGFWKLESLTKMAGPMLPLGDHVSMHSWVLITAACFVVFTIVLSSYLLFQHLSTYNGPEVSIFTSFPDHT